jgi:hypothetical protein
MKLGIKATVAQRAILEHISDGVLGITDDIGGLVVEDVMKEVPDGVPAINTCIGAKILERSTEHMGKFLQDAGFSQDSPSTFLYGILSPNKVSDWIELNADNRFMSGGVGPTCGLVQACALPCGDDIYAAFPSLELVVDMLHQIQYSGEICIGVNKQFELCNIIFGHCTAGFALFSELATQSPQSTLEFAFGNRDSCSLHKDSIAICTLLSYPPYPYSVDYNFSIMAPRQAEKHLYRFQSGACELAYASSAGEQLFEARRRLRRTLENCKGYNDNLQYRIDAGQRLSFVYSQDLYKEKGGHS